MAELVDAYLLVLRLKHDLQTWGSSTHRGLVHMSPSAIKKNTHHAGSSPALTTKKNAIVGVTYFNPLTAWKDKHFLLFNLNL